MLCNARLAIREDGTDPGQPDDHEARARVRARSVGLILWLVVATLAGSVIAWKVWLLSTSR